MRVALEEAGTLVRYAPGAVIQQRGDDRPGLSIVTEGAVRLSATGSDGETVVLSTLHIGDSFGEMTLFADIPRSYDAVAVGDTAINQLSRDRFTQVLDRQPALRDYLLSGLARQLSRTLQLLDDQRRLPASVRLAKTLLDFAEPDGDRHIARASQTDLAEAIAASRVTAGKALAELAAAGLIETAYGRVVVRDMGRLRQWVSDRSALAPLI